MCAYDSAVAGVVPGARRRIWKPLAMAPPLVFDAVVAPLWLLSGPREMVAALQLMVMVVVVAARKTPLVADCVVIRPARWQWTWPQRFEWHRRRPFVLIEVGFGAGAGAVASAV
ncbi:unnamed protein product [Pseudo-nitzschia multistriata]|uniref:Uncharacterized protein n=1 Tax=Pseudo-nitzschia multistriata TaxID=183589 RepID=A0A448ZDN0_9STRA|nr:unnamed protein product [Pseudo-nitzschia multistriata]